MLDDTKAEKVIRNTAITYSVHAMAAFFGLPPFLLQGAVQGAMYATGNINLSAVTAALPGVLSSWARPLANLSDSTVVTSAFARLGLDVPDWVAPLANISNLLASTYDDAMKFSEFMLKAWANVSLPGGNWTTLIPANLSLSIDLSWTELFAYSAMLGLGLALPSWSNITSMGANWSSSLLRLW